MFPLAPSRRHGSNVVLFVLAGLALSMLPACSPRDGVVPDSGSDPSVEVPPSPFGPERPDLDGASFNGDVAPGPAADNFLAFLEGHVGAIVRIDVRILEFEGEDLSPPLIQLRGECPEDPTRPCPEGWVVIEGEPTGFGADEAAGRARLRGRYGIEVPRHDDGWVGFRLVANPVRRSELEDAGGEGLRMVGPEDEANVDAEDGSPD